MISKKKIIAIVAFILMGFVMFTFANPSDGIDSLTTPIDDQDTIVEPVNNEGELPVGPVQPIVVDNAPVIKVTPETVKVVKDAEYDVMTGVTVEDDKDTGLVARPSITIDDMEEVGSYEVTYTVVDSANNTATAKRTVIILAKDADEDNDGYTNEEERHNGSDFDDEESTPDYPAAPTIINSCDNFNTIVYDAIDFDKCFTAIDEFYGDKGVTIELDSKEIDFDKVGSYKLTVTAKDILKNETIEEYDVVVSKRKVTVTIDDKSKKYLDEVGELTSDASSKAYKGNSIGVELQSTVKKESVVGNYDITAIYTNDNYDVTFVGAIYTVVPRKVDAVWSNTELVYNGEKQAPSVKVTDDLGNDIEAKVAGEEINVGNYTATATIDNSNYELKNSEVDFAITKAERPEADKAELKGYEGIYDGNSHTYAFTGKAGDVFTPSTETTITNVGTVTVKGVVSNPNYKDYELQTTLVVTAKEVIVKANSASKAYGETNPEFTATIEGTINSDTVVYTLTRNSSNENVGTYENDIVATGATTQGNYSVSYVPATFTITKAERPSEDRAQITGYEGIYDGKPHTYSLVKSADETVTFESDITSITNAGELTITAKVISDNYKEYTISTTLKVNPKSVTVTAENKSKRFGDEDPEFTAIVEGTINGDTIAYSISKASEKVGENAIVVAGEARQGNYSVTYVNAILTVENYLKGIKVREANPNTFLNFTKGKAYNISDYIVVEDVYADGSVTTTSEYTTDFTTSKAGKGIVLTVKRNNTTFVNKSLKYNVIEHITFQSKFEVVFKENNYRETKDDRCTQNCDSDGKTRSVSKDNNFLEIIEHYDEIITIDEVKVTYENGLTKALELSNSVRYSRKENSSIYDPVRIATNVETETDYVLGFIPVKKDKEVDVISENRVPVTVEISYNRKGYGDFVVTFVYNKETKTFKAVGEK